MCVALPGKIVAIGSPDGASLPATVDLGGTEHRVDLVMTPEAVVGDFVIVHSGYAIRTMPECEALAARQALGVAEPS